MDKCRADDAAVEGVRVTLRNDFHGTEAVVRARPGVPLSPATCRRLRARLCGLRECGCGDFIGCHGLQYMWIDGERHAVEVTPDQTADGRPSVSLRLYAW